MISRRAFLNHLTIGLAAVSLPQLSGLGEALPHVCTIPEPDRPRKLLRIPGTVERWVEDDERFGPYLVCAPTYRVFYGEPGEEISYSFRMSLRTAQGWQDVTDRFAQMDCESDTLSLFACACRTGDTVALPVGTDNCRLDIEMIWCRSCSVLGTHHRDNCSLKGGA